ncbi:MAG: hypothetical protein KAJ47_01590 [Candidatus Aenigmarchaeota archaeon]|nr:hypothetical protein [Candidatus Aenigmarchaeota archaeon]
MKHKKGVAESHLMIEIAGLLILAMTAVLIYFVVTGGIDSIKTMICGNADGQDGLVSKVISSIFSFC